MDQDEYIKARLEVQIDWYDTKSQRAQKKFKALRIIEVVCAAAIPIIAGFSGIGGWGGIAVALLGAVIAVCAAVIGLGDYQENWVEYRTVCESLRHEKYLFLTSSTPYDSEGRFALFVQRVEGMISKENSKWSQYIRAPAKASNSERTGADR